MRREIRDAGVMDNVDHSAPHLQFEPKRERQAIDTRRPDWARVTACLPGSSQNRSFSPAVEPAYKEPEAGEDPLVRSVLISNFWFGTKSTSVLKV